MSEQNKNAELADLRDAVAFLDKVRAEKPGTGTGIYRDALQWLEQAARSAVAAPHQVQEGAAPSAEELIAACVPGGGICDPQAVADAIRRYLSAPSGAVQEGGGEARRPDILQARSNQEMPWMEIKEELRSDVIKHGWEIRELYVATPPAPIVSAPVGEAVAEVDHRLIGHCVTWLVKDKPPVGTKLYAVPPGVARDAERYRWLRDRHCNLEVGDGGKFDLPDLAHVYFSWRRREWADGKPYVAVPSLDEAIDAAIRASSPTPKDSHV